MKECLQDEQVSVVGMHLQTFCHLESTFVYIILDQVVFGLLIQLLNLRCDQSDKQSDFLMLLLKLVPVPKLFIPFFLFEHGPKKQGLQDNQIDIFLVNQETILYLFQCKLAMVYFKES